MVRCKSCENQLQEDFNICPYCGCPTDKLMNDMGELPEGDLIEKELVEIAASAEQMLRVMETPEQERKNKEKNGSLAQPLLNAGGREFGSAQEGPIHRQEKQAEELRKAALKSSGSKNEVKALLNRQNIIMGLLSLTVCICIALIIVFGDIKKPENQLALGRDYMAAGQLDKAEDSFETVLKQDKNNLEAIKNLIEIKTKLNENGSHSREIIDLINRMENFTADPGEIKNMDYRRIQLYIELGDKHNAEKLLKKYIELPKFTLESGTYSEDILFEITANSGTIYYTVDKEKTPAVYTGPIMLKSGSRRVQAWVEDENGLSGEKSEVFYYVTAKAVNKGANELKAESFFADTVTRNVLPEFGSPTGTVVEKMADDLFAFILEQQDDNSEDLVISAAQADEAVTRIYGDKMKINHRSAGNWVFDEKTLTYTPKGELPQPAVKVSVVSAQEDTIKDSKQVLTVQAVMYTVDEDLNVCHPLTGDAVGKYEVDEPAELSESLLAAVITLGIRDDGGLYFVSCDYIE